MNNEKSEVVLEWFNQVWNNSNEAAIAKLMHAEAKAHGLGEEAIVGHSGFTQFYKAFNNAYANIHVTVDKTLVDGDFVVAMCTVKATHKASGKPVKFMGTSITEIKNGQIFTGWNYFDFLSLNLQIGKITTGQLQ